MEQEAIATTKAAEIVAYLRTIAVALGAPPSGPTPIGTDNKANMLIAARVGSATTSRHFLRRYVTLRQRIDTQEIKVRHIPESQNPSDFLTKWVSGKKLRESLEFGTNSRARTAAAPRQ